MGAGVFYVFVLLLCASPFLGIVGILVYSLIRRSAWKGEKRKGRRVLFFCPSSAALGVAHLFLTTLYRPSMEFAIEASQQEEVEEEDQGDPDSPEKLFNRRLRRIRRGEPVEALELRL